MSRIFASLSIVAIVLISLVMFLGLRIGDYNGPYKKVLDNDFVLFAHAEGTRELSADEVARLMNETKQQLKILKPMNRRTAFHKLLAILAAIVTVLVNSVSITYFIGTNRWCKEVVQTYALDPDNLLQSSTIKRCSFPWSFLGILTVLAIVALGAAADPATFSRTTHAYVQPHFWASIFGFALIAFAFMKQYLSIHTHSELVDKILTDVKRIRQERGLEVEG